MILSLMTPHIIIPFKYFNGICIKLLLPTIASILIVYRNLPDAAPSKPTFRMASLRYQWARYIT